MLDVYRRVANLVGTNEAAALAHALNAWHDAMVRHRRRLQQLGFDPDGHPTWDDCPHAEARELWVQARDVFGTHADQLEFLRATARPNGGRMSSGDLAIS